MLCVDVFEMFAVMPTGRKPASNWILKIVVVDQYQWVDLKYNHLCLNLRAIAARCVKSYGGFILGIDNTPPFWKLYIIPAKQQHRVCWFWLWWIYRWGVIIESTTPKKVDIQNSLFKLLCFCVVWGRNVVNIERYPVFCGYDLKNWYISIWFRITMMNWAI